MKFLICLLFLLPSYLKAQSYIDNHFGGQISVIFNVGTHSSGIGIGAKAYYTDYFYQFNVGSLLYLNEHGLGGRRRFIENKSYAGIVLVGGKREMPIDFQFNGLNHQTDRNLGVGFNYIWYHDNAGTTQRSGGMAIHINNISIYHENDAFAGQAKDRFRTAHILFTYRDENFRLGAGVNMWTGETGNSYWQRIPLEKCPSGFRVLEDLPFGKTSHGIAYGGLWINGPFNQIPHIKLGIDSENIRHAVQNRLVHDLIFLPKKIERNTPHYPRLDIHGCPVFERKEARPSRPFLQLGINDDWTN